MRRYRPRRAPLRRARLAARPAGRAGPGGQPDRRGAGRRRRHRDPRAGRRAGHRRARRARSRGRAGRPARAPRSPRSTASTSRTSGPSSASRHDRAALAPGMAERMVLVEPTPTRCSLGLCAGHLPRARVRLGDGGADRPARRGGPRGRRRALRGVAGRLPRRVAATSSRPTTRRGAADLAWAALGQAGLDAGRRAARAGLPRRERQQLALLARIADGVVMSRSGVGPAT